MRRGLNRDAVLDAAISIGDRNGFSAITVGTLATALKIKPPSLYKHVSGIDDIIDGVGIRGANLLVTEWSRLPEGKNPEKTFLRACESYRAFAMKNPTCYAALQPAMARRSPEFQLAAGELLKAIFTIVSDLGVPQKELVHAVRALRSMLHGFVTLQLVGGFGMPEDIETSFRKMLEGFLIAHAAGR
ncbi:MAG: TetR/AcrR family transcriptional regulator [Spirochaetota bacterium]